MILSDRDVTRCRSLMKRGKLTAEQAAVVVRKGATGDDVMRGLEQQRARRRAYEAETFGGMKWKGNIIKTNIVPVPDDVQEDADLRAAAPWRSFSHWLTGCPRFGYSALDGREPSPSIVPRLAIVHDKLDDRMFKPPQKNAERVAA